MLYCMVRHFKPRRVVEVGAGSSTNVLVAAFRKNKEDGSPVQFTSIEPFPSEHAINIAKEFGRLIPKRAEEVDPAVWLQLEPGDLLFIDSSHLLRIDSELIPMFLRIVPSLPKGVIIHVHDIYLPNHYPIKFYMQRWYWNEQYLLQALLSQTDTFEVLFANHYMFNFLRRRDKYAEVMKPCLELQIHLDLISRETGRRRARFPVPSSFYMRKIR